MDGVVEAYLKAAPKTEEARSKKLSIETVTDKIINGLTATSGASRRALAMVETGERIDQKAFRQLIGLATRLHKDLHLLLQQNALPLDALADEEPAQPQVTPSINKESAPRRESRRQPRETAPAPAPEKAEEIPLAAYPPEPVPERPVENPMPPTEEEVTELEVIAVAEGTDSHGEPAQHGVFGIRLSKPFGYLSHNLDDPTAVAAFGSPGAGKSYFVYGKFEAHLRCVAGINSSLKQAGCGVIPRIGAGPDIDLEFLASAFPNRKGTEVDLLRVFYQVEPAGVPDQAIWCLAEDVPAYRARYPYAMSVPLYFDLRKLSVGSFTRVMGAHSSKQPLYMRELVRHLRDLKIAEEPTLGKLRDVVKRMNVPDAIRKLASARLDLIEPFVRDHVDPRAVLVKPGRAISLAITTDTVTQEDGMLLASLALDTLALRSDNRDCPLVILFDECHEHFASPELTNLIVHLVKRRRHIGCSTLFSTHDPRCFRDGVIGILDAVAQFATDDKEALKVLARELSVFENLKPEDVAVMDRGHGWFWARSYFNSLLDELEHLSGNQLYHVLMRPRFAHHGGATKRAVK